MPKIIAARAVGELARRAGRGGGTSLPGRVLMALEPGAIGELASRLQEGCAVISATNGKTTTAAMSASVLSAQRHRSRSQPRRRQHGGRDRFDAAVACAPGGRIEGELGLFEVDEFWLGEVADAACAASDAARQPVP